MADSSDVEEALGNQVGGIIFAGSPFTPVVGQSSSVLGLPVRIRRGWPNQVQLNKDLAAGILTVSVFSPPGGLHNTTRWERSVQFDPPPPQLFFRFVAVPEGAAPLVTLTGVPLLGQIIGFISNGTPTYRFVLDVDTLQTLTSYLVSTGCFTFDGTHIRPAPGKNVSFVNAIQPGPAGLVVRQQMQRFQISVWAPTPAARDACIKLIDPVLADLAFLFLSDGTYGRLLYDSTVTFDTAQNSQLYRRDLFYTVDYPTLLTQTLAQMLFGKVELQVNGLSTVTEEVENRP